MAVHNISDMQTDHKHWLGEIERWQGSARTWISQEQRLVDEIEQFQQLFKRYGADLKAHEAALDAHLKEIVDCERGMVEKHRRGVDAEPALVEFHRTESDHHAEQLRQHERLKRLHHILATQIAMLREAASHEE